MVSQLLSTAHTYLSRDVLIVVAAATFLLGSFLFWRSVQRTTAVEEGECASSLWSLSSWSRKSFDLLVLSLMTSLIIGRIAYVIAFPDDFAGARWFWLPYERIEGVVRVMGCFPWLFLRFWDGGILPQGAFLGWMLALALYSRLMSVPWRFMTRAVADLFWLWLVMYELYLSVAAKSQLSLIVVGVLLALAVLHFLTGRTPDGKEPAFLSRVVSLVWRMSGVLGLPVAIAVTLLEGGTNGRMAVIIPVGVGAILVGLWILIGELSEFRTSPRGRSHSSSSLDGEQLQPSVPSVPRTQTWRRFASAPQEGKRLQPTETRRSFARSYRHFSGDWQNSLGSVRSKLLSKSKRNGGTAQPAS